MPFLFNSIIFDCMKKIVFSILFTLISQITWAQLDSVEKRILSYNTLHFNQYDSILNAYNQHTKDSFNYFFFSEKSSNFIRAGKYDSAYYYAERGLKIAIQQNDSSQLMAFYKQLGNGFYYNIQKEKAKQAYLKGLSYRRGNENNYNVAALYNNVGGIYADFLMVDSAEIYLKIAYKLFEAHGESSYPNMLQAKRVLATAYANAGKNNLAKQMLLEVLQEAKKVNLITQQTASLIYLANIFENEGNIKQALRYSRKAYEIQLNQSNKDVLLASTSHLSRIYGNLKQYDSAYFYSALENSLRTSIYQDLIAANVSKMEVEFETQRIKDEKKIAIQNEKNKSLELEVSEKNQRIIIGVGIIIFMILLSISIFFYSQKRIQKTRGEKKMNLERTQAILEGEEQERERLSRDLHDGVGQLLAGVKLNLNALGVTDNNTVELLDKSIREVRNISHDLLPEELKNKELEEALKSLCSRYNQINQFSISFIATNISPLDTNTKKHIYRVVQELLNNGIKHSDASLIIIELRELSNKLILLKYQDNGKGFSNKMIELSTGIGWRNILARLEILAGKVSIDNTKGGTALIFKFPR